MLTLRGIYDGKTIRILPSEPVPPVHREVPVAIIFLEDILPQEQTEIAKRMRNARDRMAPLGMSVKDLVEQGRER